MDDDQSVRKSLERLLKSVGLRVEAFPSAEDPRHRSFFFDLPAATYLGFWAIIQVFSGTLSLAAAHAVGGIAWWAHVGGFSAGIVLQFLFVRRGRAYRRPSHDEYGIEGAWLPRGHWRAYP